MSATGTMARIGHAALFRAEFVLLAFALAAAFASLTVGAAGIPFEQVIAGLLGKADPVTTAIMRDIRLPRVLLSLLVGAVLGLSGASLQGFLRNPLAEPATLGISSAASLGAVIALYSGLSLAFPWTLPLFAIAMGLGALLLLLAIARYAEGPLSLILGGIALSTFGGAAVSLVLNLSPNPFAALEITFWLLGSVEDRSLQHVILALPFAVIGAGLLLWDRAALDALSLGEDTAETLGFDLRRVRLRLVTGIGLAVGSVVAVSGSIGFVGLVVPHLVRPFAGPHPSRLLIPSAIAGAALLTAADVLVRLIPTTNELKLGVVTAFLGAPFFLMLLFRRHPRDRQ
jgi:iron complex transport system permease protein